MVDLGNSDQITTTSTSHICLLDNGMTNMNPSMTDLKTTKGTHYVPPCEQLFFNEVYSESKYRFAVKKIE